MAEDAVLLIVACATFTIWFILLACFFNRLVAFLLVRVLRRVRGTKDEWIDIRYVPTPLSCCGPQQFRLIGCPLCML